MTKTILALLFAVALQAQQFEAASFKHSASSARMTYLILKSNYWSATNAPLLYLMSNAYDLPQSQLHGPAWIESETYDLQARAHGDALLQTKRVMLQHLLEERLKMTVVREVVEENGYRLVTKGTPIVEKSTFADKQSLPGAKGSWPQKGATMADLARFISRNLGEPVVDFTNLEGRYDIDFPTWTVGTLVVNLAGGREGVATMPDEVGSTIFDSAHNIGLDLVKGKVPVPHLRITHAVKEPLAQ